ncbi:MAG: zinc ABC transporter substrate-binding protein, partial [Verrucomicrobia bacterium]|nr:zinc ABC transporter substrate-binding protein [Verrucomicrobiota bacterium]
MIFHQLNCFFVLALVCLCPLTLFAKPTVVVSIPPQKAFVQAVAGDEVEVIVLMQPGQNPSSFTISPRQLAALSKAEIYFSIGVPMEATLLPRLQANFPGIQIVDTSAGIRKRSLEDHVHGQGDTIETHAHTKDPHIWLSAGLVKVQIR